MLLQFCFSNGRESGVFCLNKLIQQSFYLKKETWAATWCWLEFRYIINTLMFPDSVTKTELRHLNWSVFWVSISFRKVWKCENFFPHKTSTCKWILPHVGHRVTCVEFTRVNGFFYQAPERSRIFFFSGLCSLWSTFPEDTWAPTVTAPLAVAAEWVCVPFTVTAYVLVCCRPVCIIAAGKIEK